MAYPKPPTLDILAACERLLYGMKPGSVEDVWDHLMGPSVEEAALLYPGIGESDLELEAGNLALMVVESTGREALIVYARDLVERGRSC